MVSENGRSRDSSMVGWGWHAATRPGRGLPGLNAEPPERMIPYRRARGGVPDSVSTFTYWLETGEQSVSLLPPRAGEVCVLRTHSEHLVHGCTVRLLMSPMRSSQHVAIATHQRRTPPCTAGPGVGVPAGL